ncbi:hypothetical protein, partial [Escherichia coli]|uniref:hypothetical protein n=1 Tax=Escherichia coli TaxID=562 RepID=UPI00267282CC
PRGWQSTGFKTKSAVCPTMQCVNRQNAKHRAETKNSGETRKSSQVSAAKSVLAVGREAPA